MPASSATRPYLQNPVATLLYLSRAYKRLRDIYLQADETVKPSILNECKAILAVRRLVRAVSDLPRTAFWPDTVRTSMQTVARGERVVLADGPAPVPQHPPGCRLYPWYEMQVGDSVFLRKTQAPVKKDIRLFQRTTGSVYEFFVGADPKKGTWVWRTG